MVLVRPSCVLSRAELASRSGWYMTGVGIREVAAAAGVSIATASYAINHPDRVSARSAAVVAEAVRTLGYVPNIAARQLKAGRSFAIGMSMMNLENPFFAAVALGAEEEAEKAGYSVLLGNGHDSIARQTRHLDLFERQRVDGVLVSPRTSSLKDLDRFGARKAPVVLVDRVDPSGRYPSVSVDDRLGGRLAARHLVAGGCRRLLFVGGHFGVVQMTERYSGFRAEALAARTEVDALETETLNMRLGRQTARSIAELPAGRRPDGVFAGNDELALGLMQGLLDAGLRIPQDVALIGYDDIAYAQNAPVSLTTIRQPSRRLGAAAAEMLVALMTGGELPESVRFEPAMIERDSTRATA